MTRATRDPMLERETPIDQAPLDLQDRRTSEWEGTTAATFYEVARGVDDVQSAAVHRVAS